MHMSEWIKQLKYARYQEGGNYAPRIVDPGQDDVIMAETDHTDLKPAEVRVDELDELSELSDTTLELDELSDTTLELSEISDAEDGIGLAAERNWPSTYLNISASRLYILLNVTFASICRNETWQIPPAKKDNQLQLHTYLPTINLTQNHDFFEWEGLQVSSLCLLCNMTIESEDYLYHDYSYSFDLWSLSARRYGLTPFRDWSRTLAHNNRSAS
ncbi:hypothetical protein F2Q70_00022154 [Brassica cretica]|uniref:Uncharacterized protein n=1 Tax=Brassica cretica TaxID=69181 RepID=A0A8S9GX33_BRACR|nr:hypothetical protein F2Q70_00022154 [Brassica cretica]